MKSNEISLRRFIGSLAAATTGVAVSGITPVFGSSHDTTDKLAVLGGTSVRGKKKWQSWPQWDAEKFNPQMNDVMSSGVWSRSKKVEEFEKKFATLLEELVLFIAEIDVTVSNIKTAKKHNYTCPKIVKTKDDENFLELIDLRHPIIEANEDYGVYVPNDILLGELSYTSKDNLENLIYKNSNPINLQNNKMHGILLFGINSSGKSSLMKAIGISVILAQAGFFVPCKSMRFSIFDSIFTRISGADNIAKGLSSFAVEMMDLKNTRLFFSDTITFQGAKRWK